MKILINRLGNYLFNKLVNIDKKLNRSLYKSDEDYIKFLEIELGLRHGWVLSHRKSVELSFQRERKLEKKLKEFENARQCK